MEYGVRLAAPRILPLDPRLLCGPETRSRLPKGSLRAVYFGTEFCADLLPSLPEASRFCMLAQAFGLEAVLLTPLLRSRDLERLRTLLDALCQQGWTVSVVFNDWGVLRLLHEDFPELPRRAGRLINRALRDPRLAEDVSPAMEPTAARGAHLRALLVRSGVTALETDPDLEGTYLGSPESGLQRVLHLPYAFAASGRNCLFKAETQPRGNNFAVWLDHECGGACRERWHPVARTDLEFPLLRAGNTLFYEVSPTRVAAQLERADRIVVHERPLP